MLFDVAAVLTTSAYLGPVAEAFGVHEISGYVVEASVESTSPAALDLTGPVTIAVPVAVPVAARVELPVVVPAAIPEPIVGPEPSPNEIVQGNRVLQQLSLLSPDALSG